MLRMCGFVTEGEMSRMFDTECVGGGDRAVCLEHRCR